MDEKLYSEDEQFDEDNVKNKKEPKKKFCLWLFLVSLAGGLLGMFLIELPALIVMVIALILTFVYRKKYKIWPQLIVILPNLVLLLFFMITMMSDEMSSVPL